MFFRPWGRTAVWSVILLFCSLGSGLSSAQDLAPLFETPTASELAAVKTQWDGRLINPTNPTADRTATLDGMRMDRISFDFDGLHQYGLLRYPRDFTPGRKYPVLVLLHGGFSGFWYDLPLHFDVDYPSGCIADSFFVVCPTYRGESLSGGELWGNVASEGEPSFWDRDCDDSMAMLTAVLEWESGLDPQRIVVHGGSRGGNVAYHMAIRDTRVKRVVVLFGPSQFRQDDIQNECQIQVDGGAEAESPLAQKVLSEIIEPWNTGQMSLTEARQLLTAWSACDFLPPETPLQVHHGLLDETVPPAHSYLVADHMEVLGAPDSAFSLYTYTSGSHNAATLHGHEELVEELFCNWSGSVSAAPPSRWGVEIEAWPNPFYGQLNIRVTDGNDDLKNARQYAGEIFDLRGRRVGVFSTLSGQTATWLPRDSEDRPLPSGQYRLRLKSQPENVFRRVILLR